MQTELSALVSKGRREKVDTQLVRSIIWLKHAMGLGIDRSNQLANELHKPETIIEFTGNLSYRTSTQEEEKSSIPQVERLQ